MARPRGLPGRVVVALTLVAVLVFYFTVPVGFEQAPLRLALSVLGALSSAAAVVVITVREVVADLRGGERRLRGVHVVMLFELDLVAFALAYYALGVRSTDQMVGIDTRVDALYFTVTTMTTVGYGDIHAVGQLARAVTTIHLGLNVVFLAALAQLVNARLGVRGAPSARALPLDGPDPPRSGGS